MKFHDPRLSLRTLSIAAVITGALGACAAPSVDERAKYLDLHYGPACSAVNPELAGPTYQDCVAKAYAADKQRAIEKYNTEQGKAGVAVLLLIH
jgi:cytochrome c551/c552